MLMDSGNLFKTLGFFASGMTVITGRRPSAASAVVTVNGFASVSLDPPLFLIGLAKITGCLSAFGGGGRFAGPQENNFKNRSVTPILPSTRSARGHVEDA